MRGDGPDHTVDRALARSPGPQGRKGEVLADLFTDFPERFDEHPGVWLAPSGFAEQVLE